MDQLVKDYERLRRVHESTNKTVVEYEGEIRRLRAALELLLEEKRQWTESRDRWTQMIQQTVQAGNEANAKVGEEMQALREENRLLRARLGEA